jgi:hypothetical protein
MSKERTSRIKPFDKYEYLKLKHLERCPFRWSTPEGADWCQRNDHRLFLIALDLYADYLQECGMDISKLQKINEIRADKWHETGNWSLLEWAGAMCGESGEGANFAKKIKRLTTHLPNKVVGIDFDDLTALEKGLAKEVADSIIYGLIILSKINVDASEILAEVFNQKSIEYGFPERAPYNPEPRTGAGNLD